MTAPKKPLLQLNLFGDATPVVPASEPSPPPRPPAVETPPADTKPDEARELAERLNRLTGDRVRSVVLTDNKTRIVSARPANGGLDPGGALDVRIHRCFADATEATLRAVAAFLLTNRRGPVRRRALRAIREHFATHAPGSEKKARRLPKAQPVGEVYDLVELRDAVNRVYFRGELEVAITWGRALPGRPGSWRLPRRRRRRRRCGFSIQLGSYDERHRLVRIHRCLDHADVPRFVIESVVYHEMLHAAVPPVVKNGRRSIHGREFRRRERLFHHHREAARWIDDHLDRLAELR